MTSKAEKAYQSICTQLKAEHGEVWGSLPGARQVFDSGYQTALNDAIEMLKSKKTLDK